MESLTHRDEEPIVAVASGTGGAVALIRITGRGCLAPAARCLPFLGAEFRAMRYGRVVDPATGAVVAGVRTEDGKRLADARVLLRSQRPANPFSPGANTTIAVVATNARLTKVQAGRMALMADDGLARAINPAHTPADGDTVFALATGRWQGQADVSTIGALAAEALSEAIVRAATQAVSSGGLPAARDLGTVPSRFK